MFNARTMNVFKNVLCVLTFFAVLSTVSADRTVHGEFNPGCTNAVNCLNISKLAYIRSEGDNDTVHFLFDFTHKPSLVVVKTVKDSVIQVNYANEQKTPITFTSAPLYTFGSVFNNLYEFNDVNDTACMDNGDNFIKLDLKRYNWNMTDFKNYNNESAEVTISANSYRGAGISKNGNVSITLKVYGRKDKGSKFPHLLHTPESGELTLTLDQLKTNFNTSRFAVELLTTSSYPFNRSEALSINRYSDDASSGGTFSNYFLEAEGEDEKDGSGYLSWKPVIYKASNTHALNSSSTVQYAIHNHLTENDWINTPLFKLFGNKFFTDGSHYLKKSINVSFGEPYDGYYEKSNYLYWSFIVGIGAPPNSSLGFLEISIIAALLLLLTVAMILIFCIFTRWMSSKRNSIIYGK